MIHIEPCYVYSTRIDLGWCNYVRSKIKLAKFRECWFGKGWKSEHTCMSDKEDVWETCIKQQN